VKATKFDTSAMPLLRRVGTHFQPGLLCDLGIVAIQHLFATTVSLFDEFFAAGLEASHAHLLGKSYSSVEGPAGRLRERGAHVTIPECAPLGQYHSYQRAAVSLWSDKVLGDVAQRSGLIVLDEGGDLLRTVSTKAAALPSTCGIEQTRSGLRSMAKLPFPVIQVADSALKRHLEPPIIANEIMAGLSALRLPLEDLRIGILGVGSLGAAIAKRLARTQGEVLVYDISPDVMQRLGHQLHQAVACESLEALLSNADLILGCTGYDALAKVDWSKVKPMGAKHFVSCSSGDIEFRDLLERVPREGLNGTIQNVTVTIQEISTTIYNGGYPINFNRGRELSSANDIQLTRALLLGGVLQAAQMLRRNNADPGGVMLNPDFQRLVAREWLVRRPDLHKSYDSDVLRGIADRDWIAAHSGGTEVRDVELALHH
jgi:S-adenosylhomocysteine hydrolase